MNEFFGWSAALFSLACVILGLPNQIWKNYRAKSCKDISFVFFFLAFFAYSSWVGRGVSNDDPFLCISQIPGAALALVILFQFWLYRKPKEASIVE